jgi:hypothetical protein
LAVQDVLIYNAYYDIMSRSFQSAAKKCSHRLGRVTLTPMLDEAGKPDDIYKSVPLIDGQTDEVVCTVCVKYWHNKQSSLPDTLASNTAGANALNNNINKRSPLESPLSEHSGTTENSGSGGGTITQNIPILSPIYFCISSANQSFIQSFNRFNN